MWQSSQTRNSTKIKTSGLEIMYRYFPELKQLITFHNVKMERTCSVCERMILAFMLKLYRKILVVPVPRHETCIQAFKSLALPDVKDHYENYVR